MAGMFSTGDFLIFPAMMATECSNVGLNTLFKAATSKGMSYHAFMVYSYAISALLLLPAPFFAHGSRMLPPLSFSIIWKMGLLGLLGCSSQTMGYRGIIYSSPTLASAMSNLTPAFTFILAIVFRMEEVSLKRKSSVAKVLGTILSIVGAFVVTLYKGPAIIIASKPSVSLHQPLLQSSDFNWVIGGAFLTVEYTLLPISYILQAQIMKEYPLEFTVTFCYCSCVSLLSVIVNLIWASNNQSAWSISPNIAYASIVSSGVLGSCAYYAIHAWAVRRKGPVFVAMFRPLSIVIAVAMGAFFLGNSLYLGSLIGATIISFGFYTMMWGKAKEEKDEAGLESPDAQNVPLLKSCNDEQV